MAVCATVFFFFAIMLYMNNFLRLYQLWELYCLVLESPIYNGDWTERELHNPKFNCYFIINIHFEITQFNCLNTRTTRFWSVPLFIIWLAPWAGKMNRISSCDWLPNPTKPIHDTTSHKQFTRKVRQKMLNEISSTF